MSNLTDPLVYVAIGGGIATLGKFAVDTIVRIGARSRHERSLRFLLDTLPEGHIPDRAAPPRERILWLESIAHFDEMTRPRARQVLGPLFITIAVALGFAVLILVSAAIHPKLYSLNASSGDRQLLALIAVYCFALAFPIFQQGREWSKPGFRIDGRRLPPWSIHNKRVRDLRRSLGVATDDDLIAYREVIRRKDRKHYRHIRSRARSVRKHRHRQQKATEQADHQATTEAART